MPEATSPSTAKFTPNRWTARIGLVLVGVILASCFGLLIAAGRAGQ
jgi:hypothetical protein